MSSDNKSSSQQIGDKRGTSEQSLKNKDDQQ